MMSRWGLDTNLAPGFLLLGFYFFVRGLETDGYLILSALFYGLSLYCYAVIWPNSSHYTASAGGVWGKKKKIRWNGKSGLAGLVLGLMAVPLLLFLLVNKGFANHFHKIFVHLQASSTVVRNPDNGEVFFH